MSNSEPTAKSMFLPLLFVGAILFVGLIFVVIVASNRGTFAPSGPPKTGNAGSGSVPISAEAPPEADIIVKRVTSELSTDPFAPVWTSAITKNVLVVPQQQTSPALQRQTVFSVDVEALTDGKQIAFRLRWLDLTPDYNVDTERFCDSCAIQFPLDAEASYTMGNRGKKVQIIQWKALWQKDVDVHFQDVADVHPNTWSDLYWFGGSGNPRVPNDFQDPRSHSWFIAKSAGNPVAQWGRTQPVEELVAEGFGTLTSQKQSVSSGRGVHKDSHWYVVFLRPLTSGDPYDYQFKAGAEGQMAIAVWDGSADNVSGRKHHSYWLSLKVKP